MLSLPQLQELIARLSTLDDKDAVQAGIEDIFYQLLYTDQKFYTVLVDNTPLASSISVDNQHLYVRLFSQEDLVQKYAGKTPQAETMPLSAIESVQLAMTGLKAGIYGYLLNEGDKWITISFSEYLSVFLNRILKEPGMYSKQCADLVTFVGELRNPESVSYSAAVDENGSLVLTDGDASIVMYDNAEGLMGDAPDPALSVITPQTILQSTANEIRIDTPRGKLDVQYSLLLSALAYCGVTKEAQCSQEPWAPTLSEWRLTDANDFKIAFEPENEEPEQPPKESPTPEPQDGAIAPIKQFVSRLPPITDVTASMSSKINALTEKVKARLPKKSAKSRDGEPSVEAGGNEVLPEEVVGVDGEGELGGGKPPFWTTRRKQIATISAGACLLVLLIGGIFVAKHLQHQKNFKQFCEYISAQDYGNDYTLYRDNHFGADADAHMRDEIDQLILKYADNTISAEELSASLRALSNFPSMEQSLLTAQVVAAKLESSKNAYVQGKEAGDSYTRLNLWRQVIDLDSVNFAAVQQHVEDNKEVYTKELNDKIAYYSTRVRAFAADRYEVLAYWYPDCQAAQHWAGTYEADRTAPLSFYPISISSVSIKQTSSGYWMLHIDWKNTSVKSIKEVCFSVIALDSAGNPVVNSDTNGSWTIFDARDVGPYAPGQGTPSSEYVWHYVFYGPMVANVQLTAVNVTYSDGSIATFTETVDLAKIYRDF